MINQFIQALKFSAEKHTKQRRKDADESPYINHPISLVDVLVNEGGVMNYNVLCAALLHDTIEDTETSKEELLEKFGELITSIVLEVTDDKSLPKQVRKLKQIEHAAHSSHEAKLVKLADKICNLRDVLASPPSNWDQQQKKEYFSWAENVVSGVRGTNLKLEKIFDSLIKRSDSFG